MIGRMRTPMNCERKLREAQDEAEQSRRELELERDHRRRESQRQQDERERERKESRRRNDPSNRLYNGDVSDFREAVACHTACLARELSASDGEVFDKELNERCNQTTRERIAAANKALEIYNTITAEALNRAAVALREAGLIDWADCLEQEDYSPMAV